MCTDTESRDCAELVVRAFTDACFVWVGCDWGTLFGNNRLNLENMTASQCVLLARATAGKEADMWFEAAQWLARIEHEAREAQKEAQSAVDAAQAGQWVTALTRARNACDIEARYHTNLIWRPLRDAIEKALRSSGQAQG